ncbi:MAG: hypothetical protein U0166_06950 [Acidobacteriota bacterium]
MTAGRALPLLAALMLGACGDEPATMPRVVVQTDLPGLQKIIRLPEGAISTRFALVATGAANPRVPGPTDYQLFAFVRVFGLDGEGASMVLGKPLPERSVTVPEDVARALLREDAQAGLRFEHGEARIEGDCYDPARFAKPPYRASFAVFVDGGLLLGFHTT